MILIFRTMVSPHEKTAFSGVGLSSSGGIRFAGSYEEGLYHLQLAEERYDHGRHVRFMRDVQNEGVG